MTKNRTEFVDGFDGTRLALHRQGAGRPVLMLHGLFSSADMNWIKFGHAQLLADAGFEAIMPDWRGHGESDAPTDAAAYPAGVLERDIAALVERLGLSDYDLVGFSLGARTAASAAASGLVRPGRLVLSGMGMKGLTHWKRRADFFLDMIARFDTITRDDKAYVARQFMRSMGIDREAARMLLTHGMRGVEEADLAQIPMPTLVLCGTEDLDNGSPEAIADAIPNARYQPIPGDHMSCVAKPDLGIAIRDFLKGSTVEG